MSDREHRPFQIVYLMHRRKIGEVFLFYMENCQFHLLITWLFLSEQIEAFWADGQIALAEACWSHRDRSLDHWMLQTVCLRQIHTSSFGSIWCLKETESDRFSGQLSWADLRLGFYTSQSIKKKQFAIYLEKILGKKTATHSGLLRCSALPPKIKRALCQNNSDMTDLSSLLVTWVPQVSQTPVSCSESLCAKLPQH